MKNISDRLKFIRENKYGKRGMAKFARQIGISPGGYLNYERGNRSIPSEVLVRIATHTSVNLHWLLTGDGLPYPNQDQEISKLTISKIRKTAGELPNEDFSPTPIEEIAVEGICKQKFLHDYWPSLKTWVEKGEIHLWLIDSQKQPPPSVRAIQAVQGFENRLVYLNRSAKKDKGIVKNLSVDAVIFPATDLSDPDYPDYPDIFADWMSRTRQIFLELPAYKDMAISGHLKMPKMPKMPKRASSLLVQLVDPYWISAFPFYQNIDALLERIGWNISQVDVVFLISETDILAKFDDFLIHALSLLALVGDLNRAEIERVNIPKDAGQDNTGAEISLRLTTYTENRADVYIKIVKIGKKADQKAEQYFQLKGASADKPSLRIDFLGENISVLEKNKPPLYLMPTIANPYGFLLDQIISGHYAQNPCCLSLQAGLEILRLYSQVGAALASAQKAQPDESPIQPSQKGQPQGLPLQEEKKIPLFHAAPTLVNSLPLTKSDKNLLLNIIGQQNARISSFQSILHADAVKGLDNSIEKEANGGIQDIPQLVKNCLIRSTIGSIAAMLVPYMSNRIAERDIQLALGYVRLIPNTLFNDKLSAYYGVIDKFLKRGETTEALQIVEEALEIVNQGDSPFEKIKMLFSIVRWYVRCGEMGKAHQCIVEINKMMNTLKPDSTKQEQEDIIKLYRQLAEAESEIGHLNQAKQLLNKSLELGKEKLTTPELLNIHLSRCAVQYAYLSLKFIGQRDPSEAKKLINQAEELIKQINDPWHQVEALLEGIKHYYYSLGNPDQEGAALSKAIDIAKSISNPTKKSKALARVIESLLNNNLDLAEDLADRISDPMEASSASLSIALAYIDHNNQEMAKLFLNQAIRLAEKTKDIQGRKDVLRSIAMKMVYYSEIEAALNLAQRTVSQDEKFVSLLQLIRSLIEQGGMASANKKPKDLKNALHLLQKSLQDASHSTRDMAIEVIGNLIPAISVLGGVQLLSDVYVELQRADEIFSARGKTRA